jgi:hypothetical protein
VKDDLQRANQMFFTFPALKLTGFFIHPDWLKILDFIALNKLLCSHRYSGDAEYG